MLLLIPLVVGEAELALRVCPDNGTRAVGPRLGFLWVRVLPEGHEELVGRVARDERREGVVSVKGRDFDRVRDHEDWSEVGLVGMPQRCLKCTASPVIFFSIVVTSLHGIDTLVSHPEGA